ncbi:MAG: hypothetical protein AB1324_03670 [Candidatus Micrarchaeota archaeon]
MAMLDFATILSFVNVLLLLSLAYVYVSNYMKVRSKIGLGLIFFAGLMLLQNLAAIYFQFMMIMYYTDEVASFALILTLLETLGLACLAYITWKPGG